MMEILKLLMEAMDLDFLPSFYYCFTPLYLLLMVFINPTIGHPKNAALYEWYPLVVFICNQGATSMFCLSHAHNINTGVPQTSICALPLFLFTCFILCITWNHTMFPCMQHLSSISLPPHDLLASFQVDWTSNSCYQLCGQKLPWGRSWSFHSY